MTSDVKIWIETHRDNIEKENFLPMYQGLLLKNGIINQIPELTSIFLAADINPLESMEKVPSYFAYHLDDELLAKVLPLPSGIHTIGEGAFSCTNLSSSIDLSHIRIINVEAFAYATLPHVTIPEEVTIGMQAFRGSTVEEVILGERDSVFTGAFKDCSKLTKIIIPANISLPGDHIFSGCSSLTSVVYRGTMEWWVRRKPYPGWVEGSAIEVVHCKDGDIDISNYPRLN